MISQMNQINFNKQTRLSQAILYAEVIKLSSAVINSIDKADSLSSKMFKGPMKINQTN